MLFNCKIMRDRLPHVVDISYFVQLHSLSLLPWLLGCLVPGALRLISLLRRRAVLTAERGLRSQPNFVMEHGIREGFFYEPWLSGVAGAVLISLR